MRVVDRRVKRESDRDGASRKKDASLPRLPRTLAQRLAPRATSVERRRSFAHPHAVGYARPHACDPRLVRRLPSLDRIPLGDPTRSRDPFTITCPVAGTGRWVDGRTWVYAFDRDLPAGLRCTFRLRDDVRTLDGATLRGPGEFAFTTGGPQVQSVLHDPDPPADRQRVSFVASGADVGMRWRLDGADAGPALRPLLWEPRRGAHCLELVDDARRPHDAVGFSVR
jgi:hypothetical protein